MKKIVCVLFLFFFVFRSVALKVELNEFAHIEQVFGMQIDSETLLPMNDLNIEFGYILYQTDIETNIENLVLEVENIRDFAYVYIDNTFQGTMNDENKKVCLLVKPGKHVLQLYVENIGRITYGPEILDNSKGLFGDININGEYLRDWKITALEIRNCNVSNLNYSANSLNVPGFHKGFFSTNSTSDIYLDISDWGMGEAWINGQYIGSFCEVEKLKSIRVPASILKKGHNEIVIFELKNNGQRHVKLSSQPVFI